MATVGYGKTGHTAKDCRREKESSSETNILDNMEGDKSKLFFKLY